MKNRIKQFAEFSLAETLSKGEMFRGLNRKIDLTQVDIAYHWVTEGKLFDACYSQVGYGGQPYILKKGKMPPLPEPNYKLGFEDGYICMTVDQTYMDPAFNEDGSCIVLNMKQLMRDFEVEDLTDNGEAEFRIHKEIINWPKYMIRLNVLEESYLKGMDWEDFRFRKISAWLPAELKPKVQTFVNHADLIRLRNLSI